MRKRLMAGVSAAAVGAATAVTALVIGTTTGWAADTTSSAWGFSATGAQDFAKTPYVESTDGTTQKSSAGSLPDNDYISASAIDLMAGNDTASSSVGSITIAGTGLPTAIQDQLSNLTDQLKTACGQLPSDPSLGDLTGSLPDQLAPILDNIPDASLSTLCDAIDSAGTDLLKIDATSVKCDGDTGTMNLGDIELLGTKLSLPVDTPKNFKPLPDNPLLTITANKQVKNDDGSFDITGLSIDIAGQETINLLGAECGKPQAEVEPTSSKKSAPKPAPVTTDLPVTG